MTWKHFALLTQLKSECSWCFAMISSEKDTEKKFCGKLACHLAHFVSPLLIFYHSICNLNVISNFHFEGWGWKAWCYLWCLPLTWVCKYGTHELFKIIFPWFYSLPTIAQCRKFPTLQKKSTGKKKEITEDAQNVYLRDSPRWRTVQCNLDHIRLQTFNVFC
jgi:hypothetical protein